MALTENYILISLFATKHTVTAELYCYVMTMSKREVSFVLDNEDVTALHKIPSLACDVGTGKSGASLSGHDTLNTVISLHENNNLFLPFSRKKRVIFSVMNYSPTWQSSSLRWQDIWLNITRPFVRHCRSLLPASRSRRWLSRLSSEYRAIFTCARETTTKHKKKEHKKSTQQREKSGSNWHLFCVLIEIQVNFQLQSIFTRHPFSVCVLSMLFTVDLRLEPIHCGSASMSTRRHTTEFRTSNREHFFHPSHVHVLVERFESTTSELMREAHTAAELSWLKEGAEGNREKYLFFISFLRFFNLANYLLRSPCWVRAINREQAVERSGGREKKYR